MAVVKNDAAKRQIMRRLNAQGYKAYSRLLDLFDIYLTDTSGVIGYMVPGKASIVLNKDLSIDQVSTIVRHEILHEYLNHAKREADFSEKHKDLGRDHETANIAMDFEISNKGYTDADKVTARSIVLGNEKLRGLVTEDQYKGWENKSFEEMYEELLKQRKKDMEQLKQLLDQMQKLSKKDLEDLEKAIEEAEQQSQDSDQQSSLSRGSNQQSNDDPKDAESRSKLDDANEQNADSKSGTDKLDKLADALKDIKKDLDKVEDGKKDEPFDTPKEQKVKKDLVKRVAEIKEIFNDEKAKQAIFNDNIRVKKAEQKRAVEDDLFRKGADPLNKFKLNLQRFIADQLGEYEDSSYRKFNPTYEDSGFIMPGVKELDAEIVPRVNVYHDVSGSFDDPAKTEMAMRAIDTLSSYIRKGELIVNRYYFANRVGTSRSDGLGGGTSGQPILDHIQETKPTNVIVLTDSDISDCISNVKVPGAVWMLFYGSRSQNLMDHLHGRRQTKYYDITWK